MGTRTTILPMPDSIPAWLQIVLGLIFLVAGVAGFRRPRRHGYGVAVGEVVEHRQGKRPTIVEFVPEGASAAVRFKHSARVPIGTTVPVSYSLLDPRNATAVRDNRAERVARPIVSAVGVLLGLTALVAGVSAYL